MTHSLVNGSATALAARPARSRIRRVVAVALIVSAGLYLAHYLYQSRQLLADAVRDLRPGGVVAAVLFALAMMVFKSLYHAVALRRLDIDRSTPGPNLVRVLRAYALSQVVRYLPGKVLGVVYEAEALAGAIPLHRIVVTNLVQYAYTNALSLGILSAVAAWVMFDSVGAAVLVMSTALALAWLGHRLALVERLIALVTALVPRLRGLPALVPDGRPYSTRATLLLTVEWIPFFLFWWVLLPADRSGLAAALVVGSCYAAASLLANLAVVMPSGLVVREALFLWIGSQLALDSAALLVLGVLSRLLFTIADVALAPLAIALDAGLSRLRHD